MKKLILIIIIGLTPLFFWTPRMFIHTAFKQIYLLATCKGEYIDFFEEFYYQNHRIGVTCGLEPGIENRHIKEITNTKILKEAWDDCNKTEGCVEVYTENYK